MNITINGTPHDLIATNVEGALSEAGFTGKVATALNGAFVPKGLRATTPLTEGAALEVLAPMQGG
ncbi:sulfur carrier protein ThiS [Falsirhodobacter halotolerans]|uniref:sulfur carrier protein ThiS n=1 Tax=Falsirhodobacter halotolerans TaxID=1146892 RepID=UPI001FD39062|nr:sulfur carrier protein ThiS [Falsirhodobacter halotolerans]MCJ8139000.1 sulfur carrier protein ThiS [Falsirhodobacter halotolerans]